MIDKERESKTVKTYLHWVHKEGTSLIRQNKHREESEVDRERKGKREKKKRHCARIRGWPCLKSKRPWLPGSENQYIPYLASRLDCLHQKESTLIILKVKSIKPLTFNLSVCAKLF